MYLQHVERFINILILEQNKLHCNALQIILSGNGNNLIFVKSEKELFEELEKKSIGLILISLNKEEKPTFQLIEQLSKDPKGKHAYKIVISEDVFSGAHLVKGMKKGAIDFISKPFNPNLVKAKIEVFKSMYFKDLRINQLLNNIFPKTVLSDLNNVGKFSPKKVENATVIFTDFIAFSKIAKQEKPLELLKKLETYFNKFDEIVDRYQLEKIKTIGDAYMATAGITDNYPKPEVRACLAAIEMKNYMINQANIAKATKKPYWEIRIGIHAGPLVAGIIGNKKMSFDVWGDTVNTAAITEHRSAPNAVNITEQVASSANSYFNLTHRGDIKTKHGGYMDMYFLDSIKSEFSLFNEGELAGSSLRKRCGLLPMDFEHARKSILTRLKSGLSEKLYYHDIKHTLDVEKAAIRLAKLEGIKGESLILLRTAVLFHDSGYLFHTSENEYLGIGLAQKELPKYGYSKNQITIISNIIKATTKDETPSTLLEKIMCDADHDYLGRVDYSHLAKKLRRELDELGHHMNDKEWVEFQLNYLEDTHAYYTQTAINIRQKGKEKRINELKQELKPI